MKIVFEHEGRKTTVLGNDYNTLVEKIRSIFPNQKHRRIQFYDPELTDYFEFTSYEQVMDQQNGLKMSFDMSTASKSSIADHLASSPWDSIDDNLRPSTSETSGSRVSKPNITPQASEKRSRKKPPIDTAVKSLVLIISLNDSCFSLRIQMLNHRHCQRLPMWSSKVYSLEVNWILFSLLTSFFTRRFVFDHPKAFFGSSKCSFASTVSWWYFQENSSLVCVGSYTKIPGIELLGCEGRWERRKGTARKFARRFLSRRENNTFKLTKILFWQHTLSLLLSRKKRNMKYTKTHPAPKRQRVSTLVSNLDSQSVENTVVVESTAEESGLNPGIPCDHEGQFDLARCWKNKYRFDR